MEASGVIRSVNNRCIERSKVEVRSGITNKVVGRYDVLITSSEYNPFAGIAVTVIANDYAIICFASEEHPVCSVVSAVVIRYIEGDSYV